MAAFETPFNNLIVALQLRNPSFLRQQSQGRGQVESSFKFRCMLFVDLYVAEIDVFSLILGENHVGGFKCYGDTEIIDL